MVITWPASADQNLIVAVYPSLDNTYDGEEVAIFSQEVSWIENDAVYFTFVVKDLAHFRIGYLTAAASTADPTVTSVNTRGWNWSIT